MWFFFLIRDAYQAFRAGEMARVEAAAAIQRARIAYQAQSKAF